MIPSTTSKTVATKSASVASVAGPRIPPRLRVLFLVLLCTVPVAWGIAWWNQKRSDQRGEPDVTIAAPDNKPVISLSYDPTNAGTLLISAGDGTSGGGAVLWQSTDKANSELPTRDAGAFGRVAVRRSRTLRLYGTGGGGVALYSPDGKYIVTDNGKLTVWRNEGLQTKSLRSWKLSKGRSYWESPNTLIYCDATGKWSQLSLKTGAQTATTAPSATVLNLSKDDAVSIVDKTHLEIVHKPMGAKQVLLSENKVTLTTFAGNKDFTQLAVADNQGWVYRFEQVSPGIFAPARKLPRFAHAQNPGVGSPYVTALAFSPDGKTLATGGTDGAVFLWRL